MDRAHEIATSVASIEGSRRSLLKGAAVAGLGAFTGVAALGGPRFVAAQDGTPVAGGTYITLGHQEVASMSPDDDDPSVQLAVISQIHNAMIQQDENFLPQPVLAAAMPEVSEDGLVWTFTLVEGVQFHDGTELTSEDVKYTFDFYGNPDNAMISANNFALVESTEAPDPLTVVVTLSAPNAAFMTQVANFWIVPAKYHAEIGEDAYKAAPIGTGAFKLKEWRAAEFTELEAFEDHFRGRPNFDVYRLNVVPEPSVRTIALETGEADSSVWTLITEDDLRLSEDPMFTSYVTSSLAVNHFPLNNEHPILSDKKVRQAFMFAIDRQAIIDEIFSGAATLATANLSPAMGDFFTADVAMYEYDEAKAAALLDEAGWALGSDGIREKDGEKLSIVCTVITGDQARRPEAELVQAYLAAVGVDMQIEEAPVATILEGLRSGDMDMSLFNWTYGGDGGDPDAASVLASDATNNFSHFKNDRVDELLTAGLTELDPTKRAAIYHEIQQIVAEEVPFLFIMYLDWFTHFNTRIQGLPDEILSADNLYFKANDWWIAE